MSAQISSSGYKINSHVKPLGNGGQEIIILDKDLLLKVPGVRWPTPLAKGAPGSPFVTAATSAKGAICSPF
ncbi:hypothetical protein V6N13_073970 [Hibiscus sabdariffa]